MKLFTTEMIIISNVCWIIASYKVKNKPHVSFLMPKQQ